MDKKKTSQTVEVLEVMIRIQINEFKLNICFQLSDSYII
jgi:hypothetical protein